MGHLVGCNTVHQQQHLSLLIVLLILPLEVPKFNQLDTMTILTPLQHLVLIHAVILELFTQGKDNGNPLEWK